MFQFSCFVLIMKINGVQGCFGTALTFIVWTKTVETCKLSLNYLLLCSAETTKVKHVWNEVRMSK